MWINASVDTSVRETLQELDGTISILQREHDQLIPLVVEGPPHLRPLRMRQLKSIAKRLSTARMQEEIISGRATMSKASQPTV